MIKKDVLRNFIVHYYHFTLLQILCTFIKLFFNFTNSWTFKFNLISPFVNLILYLSSAETNVIVVFTLMSYLNSSYFRIIRVFPAKYSILRFHCSTHYPFIWEAARGLSLLSFRSLNPFRNITRGHSIPSTVTLLNLLS